MRSPDVAKVEYRPTPSTPLAGVTVELTPEVMRKLENSFKFSADEFRAVVERALTSNQLLDASKASSAPVLKIKVTKIRVRSTFNAMMWGAMAGNDSLTGEVTIVDTKGTVLDKLQVSASYALGGWGGGQDAMRLNWLYEAFVKEMVRVYREGKGMEANQPSQPATGPVPAHG
jgi:hypothetical protein